MTDYANSRSLPGQEAESLAENSLDGEPCALWSGTHMQRASWLPAKTTDASRLSRSGMTFRLLTDDLGEGVLMSFLEAFPARTFPAPEREPESTASEAVCGDTWRELSAKFDRGSSSWKTHQCLWEEDLPESSVTLPGWGMMRDGVLWERITPALLTSGTESGLWRSPSAHEPGVSAERLVPIEGGTPGGMNRHFDKHTGRMAQIGLIQQVRLRAMWPTPCASEARQGLQIRREGKKGSQQSLSTAVVFATPQARDYRTGQQSRWENPERTRNLNDQIGGQLNPTWVELLMGWPENWTYIETISHVKYLQWLMENCNEETRDGEALRVLRSGNAAKEVSREIGRPVGIQEATVLLSLVCEHADRTDQARVFMACAEALESGVRGVRASIPIASAPHRPTEREQLAGEHSDSVQTLSRLLAHYSKEAWQNDSWENAVPRVVTKVAYRVDRLKAIGNGQVPAVVRLAWEILSEQK